MLEASKCGSLPFRNNRGAFKTDSGGWVEYGVGGDGGSDVILINPVLITQEMVGTIIGQFVAAEIKRPGYKPSGKVQKERHEKQSNFIKQIIAKGGAGGFVHSPEEMRALLDYHAFKNNG